MAERTWRPLTASYQSPLRFTQTARTVILEIEVLSQNFERHLVAASDGLAAQQSFRINSSMPDSQLTIAEIDNRIAALRENLRELVEQAAAFSGAADEELMSRRINDQEAELEVLMKQRETLLRSKS